jgi:hypothetical protein
MQVATKLAIGLGALFLVGVLLAAISNHRAPAVAGASPEPGQEAQSTDHATVPGMKIDEAKSQNKVAVQNTVHSHVKALKASESAR